MAERSIDSFCLVQNWILHIRILIQNRLTFIFAIRQSQTNVALVIHSSSATYAYGSYVLHCNETTHLIETVVALFLFRSVQMHIFALVNRINKVESNQDQIAFRCRDDDQFVAITTFAALLPMRATKSDSLCKFVQLAPFSSFRKPLLYLQPLPNEASHYLQTVIVVCLADTSCPFHPSSVLIPFDRFFIKKRFRLKLLSSTLNIRQKSLETNTPALVLGVCRFHFRSFHHFLTRHP